MTAEKTGDQKGDGGQGEAARIVGEEDQESSLVEQRTDVCKNEYKLCRNTEILETIMNICERQGIDRMEACLWIS